MQLPSCPIKIRRRVEFSQTDAAGLIHFSTYFTYMEAAEAELFRQLGLSLLWREGDQTCGFPRVDVDCRFRHPLAFDEEVVIELRLEAILANRLEYHFTFFNADGKRCARGRMITACAVREEGGDLRAVTLPERIRSALEKWKNQGP